MTDIHIVPFFDEENPESYSLAIGAKMDEGKWHTFLLPINTFKAEFRSRPPVEFGFDGLPLETGYDIPEGFGPLDVIGNIGWTESSGWVRFNESGKMVEAINMETGQWEEKKLTSTPEVTLEPEYEVLATNSIDTSVDMIYINSQIPEPLKDFSEEYKEKYEDTTLINVEGYLFSYEYGKMNGDNFLNILFVNSHGVIKVKVDLVFVMDSGRVMFKWVDKMEDEDISKVLDWFDDYFSVAKEKGRIVDILEHPSFDISSLGNVNNIVPCQLAGQLYDIPQPEGYCSFDPSLDTLSNEEMFEKLSNAFVSKQGLSISEILSKDYPKFSSGDNFQITLQLSQTTSE